MSILTCGLTSLISLIISIIGVAKIKKNGKKGKGMGIAGIIISSILLIACAASLILAFFVMPKKIYEQMKDMGYKEEAKIFAEWVGISTKKSDSGDDGAVTSNGREWWD